MICQSQFFIFFCSLGRLLCELLDFFAGPVSDGITVLHSTFYEEVALPTSSQNSQFGEAISVRLVSFVLLARCCLPQLVSKSVESDTSLDLHSVGFGGVGISHQAERCCLS